MAVVTSGSLHILINATVADSLCVDSNFQFLPISKI